MKKILLVALSAAFIMTSITTVVYASAFLQNYVANVDINAAMNIRGRAVVNQPHIETLLVSVIYKPLASAIG